MQPPPQTVPSAAGGPPPMGAATNMFRRKSPYNRRANVPMSGVAASVQPMTDPFAFGRQTPQNTPLSNPLMQGPPPSGFPQHVPMQTGDNSHGLHAPSPGPPNVVQPVVNPYISSHTPAPSLLPGYSSSSNIPSSSGIASGIYNSPAHTGTSQSVPPIQNRPLSRTSISKEQPNVHSSLPPTLSQFPPQNLHMPVGHLGPAQDNRTPSVHNYLQATEIQSQNMNYGIPQPFFSPAGLQSHHHQQAPVQQLHQNVQQRNKPSDGLFQSENFFNQGLGLKGNWFNQPSQEQIYQQQPSPDSNHVNPITQTRKSENTSQLGTETLNSPSSLEADTGTISMFFKGDEVENEEILSSEKNDSVNHSAVDSFHQSSGHFYNIPPYPQQDISNSLSQPSASTGSSLESAQIGEDFQKGLVPNTSSQHTTQINSVLGSYSNDELEFIPNQEVLPSETHNVQLESQHGRPENTGSGLLDNAEGGPNLETPDLVSHPVRSDSVSSNYSNLSHRSVTSLKRPKELVGTFIQQESGKPGEDPSDGFFQQIDSSPLIGDQANHSMGKKIYPSNLSQPPTPSPPKPTGIFQTSANSSFEPVRSHGVGVKPVEVDQAKMVMELHREGFSVPNSAVQRTNSSDVSPGNLEQPPDNLETIQVPQSHSSVHNNTGSVFQPASRPVVEAAQALSDLRPSSRAHASRMKCESPAATLWAQNELPSFARNVVLAPAAPPVHVPAKSSNADVIQPPEDGPLDQQVHLQTLSTAKDVNISSENLENPPKIEEPPKSQASSGYASLLVSSPTESLQNQPVLLALPPQNLNASQQMNTSVSAPNLSNKSEINLSSRDQGAAANMAIFGQASSGSNVISSSTASASVMQVRPLTNPAVPAHLPNAYLIPTTVNSPSVINSQLADMQPLSNHMPLNLAPESRQNIKSEFSFPEPSIKPPVQLPGTAAGVTDVQVRPQVNHSSLPSNLANRSIPELQSANNVLVDFTIPHAPANHSTSNVKYSNYSVLNDLSVIPQQPNNVQALQQGIQKNDKAGFYLQVTKDAQQASAPAVTQGTLPLQQHVQPLIQQQMANQPQIAAPSQQHYPVAPGNGCVQTAEQQKTPISNNQFPAEHGSQESARGAASAGITHHPVQPQLAAVATPGNIAQQPLHQEQQRPAPSQTPQQPYGPPLPPSGYGYYGQPYPEYGDGRPAYQLPYPQPDPRTTRYQQGDPYRQYDPRYGWYENYRTGYREPERYQYSEPERPSSRTSQHSDRPSSRQGIAEDNYQRSARSAYEENYAEYYRNQYNYADHSRWDRYDPSAYDSRYRDYRAYNQGYWYDYDSQTYRSDPYYRDPYSMQRRQGYEDHWQYDPRYDASFDEEYDRSRDPYGGEEFDRRSVHSEHSARSVHSSHSRRSSFSSRSQQSQIYGSQSQQDLTTGAYEVPDGSSSLNTNYSYGQYQENVNGQQTFTDYQYGYPTQSGWQTEEQVPPRPVTPEKFTVPHVCAKFGPGGQLIKVLPNLPSEGQPALVEIHSMEAMLLHLPEQEEMRSFPGPLVKEETHKVDVINFAQNKAIECLRNENLIDKESAKLLWDLIVLLCRQNGTVVGTDIAELLLREHKSVWLPGKSPNEANLIDFNNEPLEHAEEESGTSQLSFLTDSLLVPSENLSKETERFRELLLFGRKKDALESAMKHGMWGHALLLASKMDSRTHARVMTRFANSLPINDPLQTVYQLMSGRMPASATCCGDEKWGDWRPHLAMVLSNLTNNLELDTRTMTTMGDTLASRGLIDAAHFCYLMAQVGFGVFTKKTTKLVLIGSNHSLPFLKFASHEAIQRTEAYEYAQSLGSQSCSLPNFQVFKFIYACQLAEMGLAAQAFHYCEVISNTVLKHPSYYSPVFVSQLIEISARLRFFDPLLKEKPEQELYIEHDWLLHLRQLDGHIKEGVISYSSDRATPHQYSSSTPSSELDQISQSDGAGVPNEMGLATENPLMTTLLPNQGQPVQGIQLMPPAPVNILEGTTLAPPLQPAPNGSIPFSPVVPLSVGPMSGFAPPVSSSVPGFGVPYEPEQTTMYAGPPPVRPLGLPSPTMPPLPEQPQNQEPGRPGSTQASPTRQSFHEHGQMDFYDKMAAEMQGGRRSRTTSQSSAHMGLGRRSRTTSESSTHSIGRERRNSAAKQSSPPPPPIQEIPPSKAPAPKKDLAPKKTGGGWLSWLTRKGKNEAHLPDDRNKSIVWDEKRQRWVNLDEPEEESKPPPPPPTSFPKIPQTMPSGLGGPPSGAPPVNVFSRKAGNRGRYVDILNPGGTKSSSSVPAPCDLFAPLAPMSIPTFVPSAVPEDQQPVESSGADTAPSPSQPSADANSQPQFFNPATLPSGSEVPDGSQSGEVPSNPPPPAEPPSGAVQFYNPAQFAQPSAPAGGSRLGRFGQRKYPAMK